MYDPHVDKLHYTLSTSDSLSFEKCPELTRDYATHRFLLKDNELTCELIEHFAEVSDAKSFIEALLRSWALDSALNDGQENFKFVYKRADILDRNPNPNGTFLAGTSSTATQTCASISVHTTRNAYPEPPANFSTNVEVETLWFRYNLNLQGKEPLPGMAYFCLTHIERLAGGREEIPSKYYIGLPVVRKLAKLTSTRGDHKTARKSLGDNPLPLTGQEEHWIKACVRRIIRRLGETSVSSAQMITMLDLPPLQ